MKYAYGILKNEFYFTFCRKAKYFIIRQDYFILHSNISLYIIKILRLRVKLASENFFELLITSSVF